MHNLASSILEGLKGRRSIYALTNESTISHDRIEELISEAILHTPSPFNSQATRIVVLLKEEHEKLWDIAREVAMASVSAELFEKLYQPRIAGFRAGYGTVIETSDPSDEVALIIPQVLFYEDPAPIKPLEEKWPMLKDEFPICMILISFVRDNISNTC